MLLPKLYDNWEDIRLIVHHQRYKPSDSSKNDIVHLKSLLDKTASSAFYLVTTNKEIPLKYSEQKSCLPKIISQKLICWSFSHPLTFYILISRLMDQMCLMWQNLDTVLFGQSSSNFVSNDLVQHPRWPQWFLVGQNIKNLL